MPKFQMQIETQHPILFLCDAAPDVTIPEVDGKTFAGASADCLFVSVLSFVDGASVVTVSDRECDPGGMRMFAGVIQAPSGVLTLSDSSSFGYLNIPVPAGPVPVEVWADHDRHPRWVWIKLSAIREI